MPTLTVDTVRADDVTFVQLLVEADRPHRVRIASTTTGRCGRRGGTGVPRTAGTTRA